MADVADGANRVQGSVGGGAVLCLLWRPLQRAPPPCARRNGREPTPSFRGRCYRVFGATACNTLLLLYSFCVAEVDNTRGGDTKGGGMEGQPVAPMM
jgi:hypothetical protein